mgnify:CR=1 FL=1
MRNDLEAVFTVILIIACAIFLGWFYGGTLLHGLTVLAAYRLLVDLIQLGGTGRIIVG